MPLFDYRARDAQGQVIDATQMFDSEDSLREHLRANRLFVVDVRPTRRPGLRRGVPVNDLIVFTRQLRMMTRAGMPLVLGLDALSKQSTHPMLRQVIGQVGRSVRNGASLSESMSYYPWVFPPMLVAFVRSGEEGGRLPETLHEAARQLEQQSEIRQKVVNAMAYPVFTLVATIGTVLFMLLFVVPVFERIYRELKTPLPAVTLALVTIANTLLHYGWAVLVLAIGGVIMLRRYGDTPAGRMAIDGWKLRLPLVGGVFQRAACANLTTSLAGLLESGVPLSQALVTSARVCGNEVFAEAARQASKSVLIGRRLSDALDDSGRMPPVVIGMLSISEQVGSLPTVLREIGHGYLTEVDYSIKRLLSLTEPLMVLLVSVIIGFVLIALYFPIFNLGNVSVQNG